MKKRLSLSLLIGLLFIGLAVGKNHRAVSNDIAGIYTETKWIDLVSEPPTTIRTVNCLALQPQGNHHYQVDAILNEGNGHVCTMTGNATRHGDVLIVNPEGDTINSDEKTPCQLQIEIQKRQFEFRDPRSGCRTFCGARASFDGETMPRQHRRLSTKAVSCPNL